jgi:hypothetical protein
MQLSQPLSQDGIARRYGALLEDSPGVLNVTWLPDEAHFHLDGHTTHSNTRTARKVKGFDDKHFLNHRIRHHLVAQPSVIVGNKLISQLSMKVKQICIQINVTQILKYQMIKKHQVFKNVRVHSHFNKYGLCLSQFDNQ